MHRLWITGEDAAALDAEVTVIPTPGHTRGSMCLLYRERWLFTGDHLAFSIPRGRLTAFRGACWYDWGVQIRSMERLARERFGWVLPGHGTPVQMAPEAMAEGIAALVGWMREVA